MKLWLFPIEPLEERYSAQWLEWFPRELQDLGAEVEVVLGKQLSSTIKTGEFLDTIDTNHYKATQTARFMQILRLGKVSADDWVLLLDGWSPAITSLAYVRDTNNLNFKIASCLHAGTWDPHDFLTYSGLGHWASKVETGWFRATDLIFVATLFHKNLLLKYGRVDNPNKIRVTGFPIYPDFVTERRKAMMEEKQPIVVFPHRLAQEKQPELFAQLETSYKQKYGGKLEWVRSKDVCDSKDAYYDLLAKSKVAVSTALQETWGIAMLESMLLGCVPVAPAHLSYPETIKDPNLLYSSGANAVDLIHQAVNAKEPFAYENHWVDSIKNIYQEMAQWG